MRALSSPYFSLSLSISGFSFAIDCADFIDCAVGHHVMSFNKSVSKMIATP